MGESLPPKREKKESRSFQSPGKTESKIDEQSTLERVSRVHRRADSKRENARWFFYAHKKLIKIIIIITIFWRPQKSVRNVARKSSRAKRVARRRARVQIVPASRKNYFLARFARASRTPSVRSLPRPPHFDKKFAHIYSQKKLCINLTHHFFLTVRGEHRGRRRALRVRHRRHNGVCVLSGRRRRLRFQVAFERLLVKGFRERHDDDLDDDVWTMMML